jgi:general secretion pathway protein M
MKWPELLTLVRSRWQQLAPREQSLISIATLLLAVLVVWWVLVSPALRVVRQSDQQTQTLQARLQRMQSLQAQAQALQGRPVIGFDEAVRALERVTQDTLADTARLTLVGERASVTVQGSSADALSQWLTQARINARAVPLEAQLQREDSPQGAVWRGTLVLGLPGH